MSMIGIDVSDRSIKIAEVKGETDPKLMTVCWSSLPPNIVRRGLVQDGEALVAALTSTMTKCAPREIEGRQVVVSIPEVVSFVRVLRVPKMAESEMGEAIKWAVKQHIPFDVERMYLDWQLAKSQVGIDDGFQAVMVGATQKDVVEGLLKIMDKMKLEVTAVEIESQAVLRSLLPFDHSAITGVLLIDLGAMSTSASFVDDGVLKFTTSLRYGGDDLTRVLIQRLNLQPTIAVNQKAAIGLSGSTGPEAEISEVLREAMTDLVQKVERVVKDVAGQKTFNDTVKTIILSGGAANLPGLVGLFQEVFSGVTIELGNPLINLNEDGSRVLSPQNATHFATAIGLALRSAASK